MFDDWLHYRNICSITLSSFSASIFRWSLEHAFAKDCARVFELSDFRNYNFDIRIYTFPISEKRCSECGCSELWVTYFGFTFFPTSKFRFQKVRMFDISITRNTYPPMLDSQCLDVQIVFRIFVFPNLLSDVRLTFSSYRVMLQYLRTCANYLFKVTNLINICRQHCYVILITLLF